MLRLPVIDPVALSLGPFNIHWYAITYLAGFAAAWQLGRIRASREGAALQPQQVMDLITYGAIGVIVGGRLGYMLFYRFDLLLDNPLSLFFIWQGGMSFHGGMIGVALALWAFARSIGKPVFQVLDFSAPLVPIGLGTGRLGNFINAELWGRPTELPWGMIFPNDPQQLPRHPSQLYECALEGVALFVILWLYSSRPRPVLAVSGAFLLGYGSFRFMVEFYRQPELHLAGLTMGQALSAPMMIIGLAILILAHRADFFRNYQAKRQG